MNGPAIVQPPAVAIGANNIGGGGGGGRNPPPEAVLNSLRIGIVADRLAASDQVRDDKSFFQLCLSLARGIDYGVANNDVPDQASRLPPVLKQVCHRKNKFIVQAAIMVLMISVKNACKMGWFSPEDTEELLTLANEVGSDFGAVRNLSSEATSFMPIVSSIMSRFYPQLTLGHLIAYVEVKPGYGTYAVDFHISKDKSYSPEEKIRLFVASKDNTDSSSCIISPQQVNLLLNGKGVERRTNVFMDAGPQLPTIVNPLLKYGTNLLQAVGHFNGHYIILIAFMRVIPASTLPAPQDYVQHETPALSSGSDSEIIEGPSRISLNCPISYRRIKTPVKGHLCKHYQCFDLSNYVEINSKRPSWRCPHCNQSVCFTDLRVDQNMVKVLQEVGEIVSEVIISRDGSWAAASSNNHKDDSQDKNSANPQGGHEAQDSPVNGHLPDASSNVYDLTKEDDEMDSVDRCEPVDVKPIIQHNIQTQPFPTNSTPSSTPRYTNEFNQRSSAQAANGLSSGTSLYDYGTVSYNMRPETQNVSGISRAPTGNFGTSLVLTDAVSPALSRQLDNFQGTNYPTSSTALCQFSASNSLQLQEMLHRQSIMSTDFSRPHLIPRNVNRSPSAIQALPVQMPTPNPQQHSRPAVSIPAASGSPVPFQASHQSNAHIARALGNTSERQRHHVTASNMAASSIPNRSASQMMGLSTPSHNINRMPQTLSQPPHLMRSSQVPRSHVQQGVSPGGVSNTPSTVQRVQLMSQQAPQMRPSQTMPHQSQSIRMQSSLSQNTGVMPPQAVARTENLIDLQSDQTWRPTGRMRGALTGQAYSAALNQFMGQFPHPAPGPGPSPSPSPRPSVSTASQLSPVQVLLANRMNAQASQFQNRPMTDSATSGASGTQPEGPRGGN